MYWLADEKTLWAEPELHARIKATGAKAGDTVLISKLKRKTQAGGYAVSWSVQTVSAEDVAKGRAALDAATPLAESMQSAPPRPATRPKALPPAKPIEKVLPPEKFASDIPRLQEPVAAPKMTAALRAAIDACTQTGFNTIASSEDIRALAITIYIQSNGGRS